MKTQFKVGDVVQLLGTNSKATILSINGDEYTIDCGRHGQHKVTRMNLVDPIETNDWMLRHMKYTLKQSTLTKLRAKLTKAINSGDAKKVLSTVEDAYAIFDKEGYPDDWSRWERAKEDFRAYKSNPYWVYDEL